MARTETVVGVFVASPSDCDKERAALEDIVAELNVSWRRSLRGSLELIRWETSTFSAIGRSAQDVINDQVGDDYDIFVGIMWGRFGSHLELQVGYGRRVPQGTCKTKGRSRCRNHVLLQRLTHFSESNRSGAARGGAFVQESS